MARICWRLERGVNDVLSSLGVEVWSGSWGRGVIWETEWLLVAWSDCGWFLEAAIAAKELLPTALAAAACGPRHTVMFHCDNQAAVAAVGEATELPRHGSYASVPFLSGGPLVEAVHVLGVNNEAADKCLSQQTEFVFLPDPTGESSPASRGWWTS